MPQSAGNAILLPVEDRALVFPGLEDRAHGAPQLRVHVLGEGAAGAPLDDGLVALDELFEFGGAQFVVMRDARLGADLFKRCFEGAGFVLAARVDPHYHVAIHLNEAPVAVVGEGLLAGLPRERRYGLVVEAEVENGVHHARHRLAGT